MRHYSVLLAILCTPCEYISYIRTSILPKAFPVCTYNPADMNNFSKSLDRWLAAYRKPDAKPWFLNLKKTKHIEFIGCGSLPSNLDPQSNVQYPMVCGGLPYQTSRRRRFLKKVHRNSRLRRSQTVAHFINR